MRSAISLLIAITAPSALAQVDGSYKLAARGERYAISLDVRELANDRNECDAAITALSTKSVIWLPHLAATNQRCLEAFRAGWRGPEHNLELNASGAYNVGHDVKAPLAIRRVEPNYPAEARVNGVKGIVILQVLIDKSGTVRQFLVLKELDPGLAAAAVDAVKQWQFQPATLNDQPVDVVFNLTVNFKLN